MPITSLKFRPGINREITSYSNEGGFFDCEKVRFYSPFPEKIGGWVKQSDNTYQGTARALHNWIAIDGSNYMGVGTQLKYYIEEGGQFFDITPIRKTSTNSVTFSATNGSSNVTVTDSSHAAVADDFVTLAGAASLGGLITAEVLNQEYQIVSITNANSYVIVAKDTSGNTITANGSDTGSGGSGGDASYQVNVGLDTGVGGNGWGAGAFGGETTSALQTTINEGGTYSDSDTTLTVTSGTGIATDDFILIENEILKVTNVSSNDLTVTRAQLGTEAAAHADGTPVFLISGNSDSSADYVGWGQAASIGTTAQIRLWSHDNFGEDLIINPRDGGIFYWDESNGIGARAVALSSLSGASNTPTVAKQVMVSDIDRHFIAFGANTIGTTVQDPLLIRFGSQESLTDFTPTATNTAGDLRLSSGSSFVQAVETKQQILIFTDRSLFSMRFIGPPFTFGLQELSKNITIISSKAAVAVDESVLWMGKENFYAYTGGVAQQIPCTVRDKVFLDFNQSQEDKVVSGVNSQWSEVWWFYASADSEENNKYVVFNYANKTWYYGTLSRTAWHDKGVRRFPIAAGSQYLYEHENGNDDDGSPMTASVESSQLDIGDGYQFSFIRQLIPDITFEGSTSNTGNPKATFTLQARNGPGSTYDTNSSGQLTRTATTPVEQFTDIVDVRLRGRSFSLKLESTDQGVAWKLGTPRVDMKPDGRR